MRRLVPLVPSALLALAAAATAQIVFEPPQVTTLPVATLFSTTPELGDLDGDGDLDAVVSVGEFTTGATLTFVNDGAGALPAGRVLPGFTTPRDAALHDMNGDGLPDYIVANGTGATVWWGDGDGGFDGFTSFAGPSGPVRLAVGLLDGDAIPDVLVCKAGLPILSIPSELQVWTGDGSTFSLADSVEIAGDAADLDLADVDGDGALDAIVTLLGGVTVQLGDGLGGLGAATPVAGIIPTSRLVAGDADGDGDVDLVLGSLAPQVQVAFNDGSGTFAPGAVFPAGTFGAGPALADVDGDGLVDVVLNDSGHDFMGQLVVLRGLGGGAFEDDVHVTAGGFSGGGLSRFGDLDGDGRLDVVTSSGGVAVFLNRTYGRGSPFLDLGHALEGSHGYPVQLAEGTLVGGTPYAFRLLNGLPGGSATLVFGLSAANLPFKGGTMVPFPDLLFFGNPMDAQGEFTIAGSWPTGAPAGATVYLQWFFKDVAAPTGEGGTSGLRFVTP